MNARSSTSRCKQKFLDLFVYSKRVIIELAPPICLIDGCLMVPLVGIIYSYSRRQANIPTYLFVWSTISFVVVERVLFAFNCNVYEGVCFVYRRLDGILFVADPCETLFLVCFTTMTEFHS